VFTREPAILLTLWSRVLFEKLIVTQTIKKLLPFMEPQGSLPLKSSSGLWCDVVLW